MRHWRDGGLFYRAIPASITGRSFARREPLSDVGRVNALIRAVIGDGRDCPGALYLACAPGRTEGAMP